MNSRARQRRSWISLPVLFLAAAILLADFTAAQVEGGNPTVREGAFFCKVNDPRTLPNGRVSALSPWVVPIALRQFFIVPVPGNQAPDGVAQHPEVMPFAKLVELACA